jgi:hypothetical protein
MAWNNNTEEEKKRKKGGELFIKSQKHRIKSKI